MYSTFTFRRLCFFLFISAVVFIFTPHPVSAQDSLTNPSLSEALSGQKGNIDVQALNKYLDDLQDRYQGYFPQTKEISDQIKLKPDLPSSDKWMSGVLRYFLHECYVNIHTLGMILILTVFSMILQSIQTAFEKPTVGKVAYALVYMMLLTVALKSFHTMTVYILDSIEQMSQFLLALTPMILALTAVSGSLSTAMLFHPMILLLINTVEWAIAKGVVPLLILSTLLGVISTLTVHYKASKLADLMRQVSTWSLIVFFAVFLGVMSIRGAVASISDGVLSKTVKFMTGNFVPVIGRMFSDATETVLSASALLKNTVGMVGLMILAGLIIFPALKVLVVTLIYRFSAALLQPLGDGPIIDSLNIISKSMLAIFAAYIIVSLMFFLSICIIIASGNLTLMVR